jgi:nicotinamide-nucleotide amidase
VASYAGLAESARAVTLDRYPAGAERKPGGSDRAGFRYLPATTYHATMIDEGLASAVAELLESRSIATAESCTAGRVAETLAAVERASEFLRGGLVAYQERVKRELLGVTAPSVLTAEAAEQMAIGVAELLSADVTIATTGVAGSEAEDGTPPGTVYIATSVDGVVASNAYRFEGSPEQICDQARHQALRDVMDALARP